MYYSYDTHINILYRHSNTIAYKIESKISKKIIRLQLANLTVWFIKMNGKKLIFYNENYSSE